MSARFEFGKNWASFLSKLSQVRILQAEESIRRYTGEPTLKGKRVLDIGSGSGLFSLAARRLGAKVYSFDYDPNSVECARELKRRYFDNDPDWEISQGSILDQDFVGRLGTFDLVYSWGVLHHTGEMHKAFEYAARCVSKDGLLYIAIYNDQGVPSKFWWLVKKTYVSSPAPVQFLLAAIFWFYFELRAFVVRILTLRNPLPFKRWRELTEARGMSVWHDLVDWVGGFPFEVAKPEEVFSFFKARGFALEKLTTQGGGHGCCEYVLRKVIS